MGERRSHHDDLRTHGDAELELPEHERLDLLLRADGAGGLPRPGPAHVSVRHHRPAHLRPPADRCERPLRAARRRHHGDQLMTPRPVMRCRSERGQVLVLLALLIVLLLAFAGIAIDIGRQVAERRHVQTAADAGALAACRELVQGSTDAVASQAARDVALANVATSASGATATIADDASRVYADGHAGDPAYLESGIIVAASTVRVAVSSTVPTTVARAIGISQLETAARARCSLEGNPAIPIVARRYVSPPGPGGGFIDFLATEATSTSGSVDSVDPRGYAGRTPASEAQPGPVFELYGPDSKANNDASFRGFVALDVRNFETTTSRVYYNGVTAGTSETTLKSKEGAYLINGYPGPAFPTVTTPSSGATQVATLSGNDSPMVVGNFDSAFDV